MTSGERWRLGHRPALDGLRGVAVLLVVLSHSQVPGLRPAGLVGVTMFFALSGFLIATLLFEETDRTGGVAFASFYARRARRLLPALTLTIVGVTVVGVWVPGFAPAQYTWGAMLYVNNWLFAGSFDQMRGLSHTWTLSIEEQFYLVAPVLILVLRKRPRLLLAFCVLSSLAVFLLRAVLVEQGAFGHVFYGTDARADAMLVGVGLAAALRVLTPGRPPAWLCLAACAALAWSCSMSMIRVTSFVALPLIEAAATVPLILAALGTQPLLSAPWLRWIGRRSYAIYLFHFPITLLMRRHDFEWWIILPVVALATGLLVELSWRFVERPTMVRGRAVPVPRQSRVPVEA